MDSTEGGRQQEISSSSSSELSTESSNDQQPPRPLDPTMQPQNSDESLKNLPNANREPVINRESVRVILSQRDYKHEAAGECRHSPMRTSRDRSSESQYSRDVDMVQLYRRSDERIPQEQSNQAYYSYAFWTESQPVAPWERDLDPNIAERRSPRFENIQKESRTAPRCDQDQPQDSFATRDSAQNLQFSNGWNIPTKNSLAHENLASHGSTKNSDPYGTCAKESLTSQSSTKNSLPYGECVQESFASHGSTENSLPYGTCANENVTSQGSTMNSLPYGDCAEDSKASSSYCTNIMREQIAEPVSQELQKYNSPEPSLAIAVRSNAMSEANEEPKQLVENLQLTIATQTEIDLKFIVDLWRSIFDATCRMPHIVCEYDDKLIWFIALMVVMIPFLTVMKIIFYVLSLILPEF